MDMVRMAEEYARYVDAVETRFQQIRLLDEQIQALRAAFIAYWSPFKDGDIVMVERGFLRNKKCRVVKCDPMTAPWVGQPDEYIDGVPHWEVTLDVLRKDGELDRTYTGTRKERLVWLPNKQQYTGIRLAGEEEEEEE